VTGCVPAPHWPPDSLAHLWRVATARMEYYSSTFRHDIAKTLQDVRLASFQNLETLGAARGEQCYSTLRVVHHLFLLGPGARCPSGLFRSRRTGVASHTKAESSHGVPRARHAATRTVIGHWSSNIRHVAGTLCSMRRGSWMFDGDVRRSLVAFCQASVSPASCC
jgi:hypothetical protein